MLTHTHTQVIHIHKNIQITKKIKLLCTTILSLTSSFSIRNQIITKFPNDKSQFQNYIKNNSHVFRIFCGMITYNSKKSCNLYF